MDVKVDGDAVELTSSPTAATPRQATEEDIGCSDKERFEMELEFVQVCYPVYLYHSRRHSSLQVQDIVTSSEGVLVQRSSF